MEGRRRNHFLHCRFANVMLKYNVRSGQGSMGKRHGKDRGHAKWPTIQNSWCWGSQPKMRVKAQSLLTLPERLSDINQSPLETVVSRMEQSARKLRQLREVLQLCFFGLASAPSLWRVHSTLFFLGMFFNYASLGRVLIMACTLWPCIRTFILTEQTTQKDAE